MFTGGAEGGTDNEGGASTTSFSKSNTKNCKNQAKKQQKMRRNIIIPHGSADSSAEFNEVMRLV